MSYSTEIQSSAGSPRRPFAAYVEGIGATNLVLLLALGLVTFYPLLSVGFTTNDDLMFAIESDQGDFWGSARKFSVSLGKVGFLWAHALIQLPYLVDSRAWYLAIKYGSVLLLLGALYFTVFRVFKSSWIAVASLVLYLALVQNGWDHNALTSYPLVFNFLLALFLVSLGLFSEAIERRSLAMAWVSAALYFLVLVNEFFVLYFPLYVAVAMAHGTAGTSIKVRIAVSRKYVLAIALALVGYLALYVMWRIIHPSEYGGTRPDGWRNLGAAAKVIVTYSVSAFPFASLHFLVSPAAQAPLVNSPGLHALLAELRVESVIKALITGVLFARLMFADVFAALTRRVLLAGAALAFVAVFLPNLPLALTKKYQGWVIDSGSTSYVYTYHSFIAAVIFGALVLALLYTRSRHWRLRTRVAVLGAGIAVTMIVSLAVDVRNQYFAFDQKLSHRKWQLMDRVIASPAFERIEDGATLVAPTLGAHQRGIAYAPNHYWARYITHKTGKRILVVDDACAVGAPCYLLIFRQEQHSENQTLVLARVRDPQLLDSADLVVYSMPNQRDTILLGSFRSGERQPELRIDNQHVTNVSESNGIGMFSARLPFNPDAGDVQIARLTGDVGVNPERFAVYHLNVEPRLQSWSAELAHGVDLTQQRPSPISAITSDVLKQDWPDLFASVSGMSGYEPWGRWTDASAGPVAKFRFRHNLPRRFALELKTGAFGPNIGLPVKVKVGTAEQTFVVSERQEAETYRLIFETDGTADTVEIAAPKPTSPNEIDPKNRDPRKLGLSLHSMRILDLARQSQ